MTEVLHRKKVGESSLNKINNSPVAGEEPPIKHVRVGKSQSNQNRNQTEKEGDEKSQNENEKAVLENKQDKYLVAIFVLRGVFTVAWISSVLYCTYHMYLAAEDLLEWQRDPVMNPGPFTKILGRGRDTTDYEWTVFTDAFFQNVIYWYILYLPMARAVHHFAPQHVQHLLTASACFSYIFLSFLIGVWPTTFLYIQPVIFWLLMMLKQKIIIWSATILFLIFLGSSWCKFYIPTEPGLPDYYFSVTAAWNAARCVSFCFDTWGRKGNTNVSALFSYIKYCFYFPLTINGPLILFEKYEKHMLLAPPVAKTAEGTTRDVSTLFRQLIRIFFWTILIEFIIHYLYFRPLALTVPALYEINWWALCGVVYWLGQFFQLKYLVMYGIPSAMAEFEGLEMPPLPKCIGYIHRYSVLWKDFDRGLYYFLIRYTYLPTLDFVSKIDSSNRINTEVRKLVASLASFTYVYIWHSVSFDVFVWAAFNFLGITIERIGSSIKRRIDAQYAIAPLIWDVVVEPVVTIPLAVMSVINSSVFCGTLQTANVVLYRFFTESHYVFHFVYFFTHVGVTVRTWPKCYPRVCSIIKKSWTAIKHRAKNSASIYVNNVGRRSAKPRLH